MTRKFVILLIVSALLFIGFYLVLVFYNRFVGGYLPAAPLLPVISLMAENLAFLTLK